MSDHDTPDAIDKAYAQAEAMLTDEAARAARRARVLGAVAAAGPAAQVPPPARRSASWARGRWLAAASVAGLTVLIAIRQAPNFQLTPAAPPQVAREAAPPVPGTTPPSAFKPGAPASAPSPPAAVIEAPTLSPQASRAGPPPAFKPGAPAFAPSPPAAIGQAAIDRCYADAGDDDRKLSACDARASATTAVVSASSRIRGLPEDAALPVEVLGREQMADRGSPNMADLLGTITESNRKAADGNAGSTGYGEPQISLRGMGSGRTLELAQGRAVAQPPPPPPPPPRPAPPAPPRAFAPPPPAARVAPSPSAEAASPTAPTSGAARLRAAATAGRISELTTLLAAGAVVDAADADGETALMKAVRANRPEAVVLLLRRGADPDRKNRAGVSAKDMARAISDAELNRAVGILP